MSDRKKLKRLTLKDKADILKRIDEGDSHNTVARDYGVVKSTITKIKQSASKIKEYAVQTDSFPDRRVTLKKCEYPTMEKHLYDWILRQRSNNVPISESIVVAKAKLYHAKYENGSFNASHGWFNRFKERHGIRMLKITGEKLSSQPELVTPFKTDFQNKVREMNLLPSQIYNADEAPLYWKAVPEKTLVLRSEKAASGHKKNKQRLTFLPCSNSTGEHKLKMLAIGKSANPRSMKNYNGAVEYVSSKTAWMTRRLFTKWFYDSFVPQV